MKFSITSMMAVAFASVAMANDMSTCAINHPHIANAIGKFCQNKNMVVPSDYTTKGMTADNFKQASVWITGNCKPAQFVPQEYCFSQLWNMCANRGSPGTSQVRKYGNKGCQSWHTYTAAGGQQKGIFQ